MHWVSEWKLLSQIQLCDPMECSPPGSSVHGILQARILEWEAIPSSRGFSQPRDRTQVFHIAGRFFTIWATREALYICNTFLLMFVCSGVGGDWFFVFRNHDGGVSLYLRILCIWRILNISQIMIHFSWHCHQFAGLRYEVQINLSFVGIIEIQENYRLFKAQWVCSREKRKITHLFRVCHMLVIFLTLSFVFTKTLGDRNYNSCLTDKGTEAQRD